MFLGFQILDKSPTIYHCMSEQISSKLVTYVTFLVTLGIVGISIISVIFPALIISNTYEFPNNLEPFETSPWALPILISIISLKRKLKLELF